MIGLLRDGEGMVIFPEGTYYRDTMGPGYAGLIRMVRSRMTLPYIPVGIRYMRKRRRTHVRIRFGHPLFDTPSETTEGLLKRIMRDIAILSEMSYVG